MRPLVLVLLAIGLVQVESRSALGGLVFANRILGGEDGSETGLRPIVKLKIAGGHHKVGKKLLISDFEGGGFIE